MKKKLISIFMEEGECIGVLFRADLFEYMEKYGVCYYHSREILEGRMIDEFTKNKVKDSKLKLVKK